MGMMLLFQCLGRAVDVFRRGKAIALGLLQPSLPSLWFSGTIGDAVLHSSVTLPLLREGQAPFQAH